MNNNELEKIVIYLVNQGLDSIKNNTEENNAVIDYVSIFSKNKKEFKKLELTARNMGIEVDKENI